MKLQRLGIIMDPIESINPQKDSSLAMMLAAQARGITLFYMQMHELSIANGVVFATMHELTVSDHQHNHFQIIRTTHQPLQTLDVILMRKDPPIDRAYLYTTHLLSLAAKQGVRVVNAPECLRDFNEKLFTLWFPECYPSTLVSADISQLKAFIQQEKRVILKPLYGLGGLSIFQVHAQDPNTQVILETLTEKGQQFCMAQKFIPEISEGDKRILLIDGEPIPYALARIPHPGDFRGNLSAGAQATGRPLSERDRWICSQIRPMLKEKGLMFVGIDVIGDYLTEINVTSATGIRELDRLFNLNIADDFIQCLQNL